MVRITEDGEILGSATITITDREDGLVNVDIKTDPPCKRKIEFVAHDVAYWLLSFLTNDWRAVFPSNPKRNKA